MTAAYGTRVARPGEPQWLAPGGDGSNPATGVRPIPVYHCLVGKPRQGARPLLGEREAASSIQGEKHQPLANAVNEYGGQVGVGDDLLGAEEPAHAVAGLDDLGRISLGQPEQLHHD